MANSFMALNRLWLLLKRGKTLKDSVAVGALGGFLGTAAMVLSNWLIFKAGKTEILYGNIAGSIFMRPLRTKQSKNFMLGQLLHFVNGSTAGLLLVQIFKKFGTDMTLLKSSMLGMFTWEVLYTVGQRLGIYTAQPHLTKTGYSALWNNLLYGAVTGYSIRWLAHPSLFSPEEPVAKDHNSMDLNQPFCPEPNFEDTQNYPTYH